MAEINGTANGEFLEGTGGDDVIRAGGGNDAVFAYGGNDEIFGEGGNDTLVGGTEQDRIWGGDDNDIVSGQEGNDVLRGEAGADQLQGQAGADDIDGGEGADTIEGDGFVSQAADSADLLNGGGGNDNIRGGGGADTIYGGGDNDFILGGAGSDLIDGGDGDDYISGFGEEVYGQADLDVDTLIGGAGFDRLVVGPGDSADGGPGGSDQLIISFYPGATSGVTADFRQLANGGTMQIGNAVLANLEYVSHITGTAFNDVLIAGPVLDVAGVMLSGFEGNDDLTGSAGVDMIYGGDGDDVLRGGVGTNPAVVPSGDRLNGEAGDDTIYIAGDGANASGGRGADTVHGGAGADEIYGDDGNDTLYGGGGTDGLQGGNGDDYLDGGGDADGMQGGADNDIYLVDDSGDSIYENEGAGTDEVRTSLATYSLLGTQLENLTATSGIAHDFRGSTGDNVLTGGAGNDLLRLNNGGNDSANGGGGNDVIYFGNAFTGSDSADGGDGRDVVVLQGNYVLTLSATNLANVESVSLQSGARTTWGDTANNFYDYDLTMVDANVPAGVQLIVNGQSLRAGEEFTFDGSAETEGKFLVYAGHGVDTLTGGAGSDVFFFEGTRWSEDDRVDGGGGRDAVIISSGTGVNQFEFAEDSFASIESISVNSRFASDPSQKPSYELVLANGNVAAGGSLIVNGSSLADPGQFVNIDGSAVTGGSLLLFGGAGDDSFIGGAGADLLHGAGGSDKLVGGAGADIFRYDSTAESATGARDLIFDFAPGSDRIDLSRIDANSLAAGDQAFSWIGSNAFSGTGAASAGELRGGMTGGWWVFEGDVNGDGAADFAIQVMPSTFPYTPGAGDFIL